MINCDIVDLVEFRLGIGLGPCNGGPRRAQRVDREVFWISADDTSAEGEGILSAADA